MRSRYVGPRLRALCSRLSYLKVAASNLRFGDGVTREVGMDLKNMSTRTKAKDAECGRMTESATAYAALPVDFH